VVYGGEGIGLMGVGLMKPGLSEMAGILVMIGLPKSGGLKSGGGIQWMILKRLNRRRRMTRGMFLV
jgi:hypothetical protein